MFQTTNQFVLVGYYNPGIQGIIQETATYSPGGYKQLLSGWQVKNYEKCSPSSAYWLGCIIPNGVEHQKLWPRALKPAMRIIPLVFFIENKTLQKAEHP